MLKTDINRYIQKSEEIINESKNLLNQLNEKSNKELENIIRKERIIRLWFNKHEAVLKELANSSDKVVTEKAKELKDQYDHLRKTTIPFNYLWYWYLKKQQYKGLPLALQKGVHFVVALMGGGKSSFIYHCIERLRVIFGTGAYINVDLEFPHYDPISREYVQYHRRFEQDEFWGRIEDNETGKVEYNQIMRFNKLFPVLVLDEWLSKMNHRLNNTSGYKDIFIPFMKSLTHMRHQGITHVYVASQLDTTDIQLMGLFKYIHEVEIDLDISYWDWVKTGMLTKHIKGWHVHTYTIKRKKGKTDKLLVKSWYEKKIMDMTYFNSLNQAKEFENLKYDNIKIKRSYV